MTKQPMVPKKEEPISRDNGKERLSLYPLTLEDAIRAAAKTGPVATKRTNRERKKAAPD